MTECPKRCSNGRGIGSENDPWNSCLRGDCMLAYSIIMFAVGVLFAAIGIAIYKGKTDLIHSYHQTKVTDKAAYGKAFGRAMLVIAVGMLGSGVVALLGDSNIIARLSLILLFAGLGIGIGCIIVIQIKYNKGIF